MSKQKKTDPTADKKPSGGSATLVRRGLVRGGGENAMAPTPDCLCVIDGPNPGDMTEAQARALYPGDKRAQEVISAILDVLRSSEPCPPYFWHSCRTGIHTAVRYVDLGVAADGVTYLFIVDGRHRKSAAVEVTAERAATNDPLGPLQIPSLNYPLVADPTKAAQQVRDLKTKANIHVPMAPSSLAARAVDYAGSASHYAVGVTIGLRPEVAEQEVPRLLALAMCVEEVQRAVDREPDLLAVVGRWRTEKGELSKSAEQQREWLAKRAEPKAARAVRAATTRPLRAPRIAAIVTELQALDADAVPPVALALIAYIQGDARALDAEAFEAVRAAVLRTVVSK